MQQFRMRKLLLFLIGISTAAIAQENIKIMHYNLTYFGKYTSFCTSSNNNVSQKDGYLKTIIDDVQPDVFTVNELGVSLVGGENLNATRILDNVMNANGVKYAKASHTGSYLCNMIYYNQNKFALKKQTSITKDAGNNDLVREIDFYTLYYKDATLATHNDTIYLTFGVAHLKAGDTPADSSDRASATLAAMNYINSNNIRGNVFFMGDLNVYSDQEGLFQNLINYSNSSINFYDPINQLGEWHNDYWNYGQYFTQATRNDGTDCFSQGGMDDRFDFILMSKDVKNNLSGVKYITDSYVAFGNDGSMTDNNSPLNTVNNSAVSSTVAQALFDMSDHLPVVMEVEIHQGSLGIEDKELVNELQLTNPVSNELKLIMHTSKAINKLTVEMVNIAGQVVSTETLNMNNNFINTSFNTNDLSQGLYLLKLTDNNGVTVAVEKFIKQ